MTIKSSSWLKAMSVLLAFLLSNCQSLLPIKPTLPRVVPATLTLSPQTGEKFGLVVGLDAPVFVKREGWKDYQGIGFGGIVSSTDLLKTEGQLLLLCANWLTVTTFTGVDRSPCLLPTTDNFLIYDGMKFAPSARTAPPPNSIPYILYPRGTAILEPRPVLRWNDTGASSYTVQIWNNDTGETILSEMKATQNSLAYPTDAPILKPGTRYLLVVIDNDNEKSSNSDPNKGLGFEVVTADDRSQIETKQNAIWNIVGLNSTAQKMVLALYFDHFDVNGRGLWGEAAALFKEVLNAQPKAPAVHLYLGGSLAKMKLWSEAITEYESALNQAQALNDLLSQAEAQAALWHITGEEAHYQEAIKLYTELNAQDQVATLKKEHQ